MRDAVHLIGSLVMFHLTLPTFLLERFNNARLTHFVNKLHAVCFFVFDRVMRCSRILLYSHNACNLLAHYITRVHPLNLRILSSTRKGQTDGMLSQLFLCFHCYFFSLCFFRHMMSVPAVCRRRQGI